MKLPMASSLFSSYQEFQLLFQLSLVKIALSFSMCESFSRRSNGPNLAPMVAFNCSSTSGSCSFPKSNFILVYWGLVILVSLNLNVTITKS